MKNISLSLIIGSGLCLTALPAAQAGQDAQMQSKMKIHKELKKLESQIKDLRLEAKQLKSQEEKGAWNRTLDSAEATLRQQWRNIKNAGSSAWDGVADGAQSAIDETRQTYREAKRNLKEWQTEERLEAIRDNKNELARELRGRSDALNDYFTENQMTLNSRIRTVEEKISRLKNSPTDTWSDAYSQTQEALDEADQAFTYAQLRVYKREAELKVQEYQRKLDQMKTASDIPDQDKREKYRSALSDLQDSMQTAREKVEDLSVDGNKDPKSFKKELDRAMKQMQESYEDVQDYVRL